MQAKALADEKIIVRGLDEYSLIGNWSEIHALEHNWTSLGESAWQIENFRRELPGKWELSNYAIDGNKVVGYMISSFDAFNRNIARINKILVDRDCRGKGIATRLWEDFIERCDELGVDKIKLRALKDNDVANKFYRNRGCIFTGETKGEDQRVRYDLEYVLRSASPMPHSKPTTSGSDCELFRDLLEDGDLASGNYVTRFVGDMARFTGQRSGVATANGTSAIFLALKAIGVGKKDEVLIPSYACTSLLRPIMDSGARAILVDINPDDYNISLEDASNKKTAKTRAIIIPHIFGQPVKNIEQFAKLGIPVIEDCAHSVGGEIHGRPIGSFGDISIFSFYATKMLTSGVGGMVLTRNEDLLKKLERLTRYDQVEEIKEAYNSRMSDLQAVLGIAQLRQLSEFISLRKAAAEKYGKLFESARVDFKYPQADDGNVFFRYVVQHPDPEALIANLRERGVSAARPVFKPLHKYLGLPNENFPNTEQAYNTAISIPIYPSIKPDEINTVAGALANWRER
jgi:perosamine synthetase